MKAQRSLMVTVYLWYVAVLAGLVIVVVALVLLTDTSFYGDPHPYIAIYNDLSHDVVLERLGDGLPKHMLLTTGNTYVAKNWGGKSDPLLGKFHYMNAIKDERAGVALSITSPDGHTIGQAQLRLHPSFGITYARVCASQFSDPPLIIGSRAGSPKCPPITNPPDGTYYTDSREEKTDFGMLIVRTGGVVHDPSYGFVEVVTEDRKTGRQHVQHLPTPSRSGVPRIERQSGIYLKDSTLEIEPEDGSRFRLHLGCTCWIFD
jgi:hypothetical protein